MKVLIVESSRDDRLRLVEALCELTNVAVVGAVAHLHSALYAISESGPDVVVTGSPIGEDDAIGLIVAAQRCARPPTVIVYAADTSYERRQRALAAGAELYITHDDGLMALQRAVIVLERDGRLRGPDRFALIGRIAAGAAHDLGNYLGVASLSLASLERRLDERMTGIERIQNELAMVRRALQAAERLASGILSYARGTTPEPEPVNLSTIVRKTLELFRRSVPTDVRIHSDLEAVPLIRGIDFELEQVVLNLILSAAEAMPEGGELGVFVGTNGNQVRLEITDSGRGLRAPLPKSTPRDNLGLGIAQTIAERHGAAMQIAPRATGGTRVLVDFVAI